MPTIQETVDELSRRLDETIVIVTGTQTVANTAHTTAQQAVQNIAFTRVDVRSYTDQRAQEIYDYITTTLTEWAETLLELAGGYADGVGDDVGGGIRDDLDGWRNDVQEEVDQIREAYERLSDWAHGTFDTEIPRILAEVAVHVEEMRQAEQDILNEADLSRQEISEMASRWREMADQIAESRDKILEMDYSIFEVKDDIFRAVSVEYEDRLASFDERITVAAGEVGAVADRVQTLEVNVGDATAMVQTLERAMIDGDEQIAQQIVALSVGTNTQFDPAKIWHFDTAREGWTGTWIDGELYVNNETQSPVIEIDASKYRQLRMRIHRIGNPTWNGYFTFQGATGTSPQTIEEPQWSGSNGNFYAEVTVNPAWSGTLTRLLVHLSDTNDVNNRYLLDWITVGRPAPGASSADVLSERLARINADGILSGRLDTIENRFVTGDGITEIVQNVVDGVRSEIIEDAETGAVTAVNTRLTSFETQLNDLESGQTGVLNAVSVLTQRVVDSEDGLQTVNQRVDSFETSIDNLANSSAFAALVNRVTQTEEGFTTLVNTDIVRLDASISTQEGNISQAQALAQSAANLAGSKGKVFVQNAEPPVEEQLAQNLWIDTTGGANTPKRWDGDSWEAVSDKIARDAAAAAAQALAGLGNKADSSAVAALSQRVTDTEGLLTSQAQDIVSLGATVTIVNGNAANAASAAQDAYELAGGKGVVLYQSATPAAQYRQAQNLWIDTTNNNNTPKRWNGTAWVSVTDKVALDAAAAAAEAMAAVATKADSTAVSLLEGRVEQTERGIDAQSKDITSLNTAVTTTIPTNINGALQAAQAAAAEAGSKGRVFFQNTAPAVSQRLPQNLWIDTTGGGNTPKRWNGTAWVAVTDKVATDAAAAAQRAADAVALKADATAVTALTTRVTTAEGRITTASNNITTLTNRLNNGTTGLQALANNISAANTRITNINGTVVAQSQSIQALTANVGNYAAEGLFRVKAVATPTGAQTRIAILAAASRAEGDTRSAGMYLEAIAGGKSRVIFEADQFAVLNSNNGRGLIWSNGALKLTDANGRVRMIIGEN